MAGTCSASLLIRELSGKERLVEMSYHALIPEFHVRLPNRIDHVRISS